MDESDRQIAYEAFGKELLTRFQVNRDSPALEAVGGNFMVAVVGQKVWTVVTHGARKGVYDDATDDHVAFAFVCKPEVFEHLLENQDADLQTIIEEGQARVDGNVEVYERFMRLRKGGSMLSVRASSSSGPSKRKRRKLF